MANLDFLAEDRKYLSGLRARVVAVPSSDGDATTLLRLLHPCADGVHGWQAAGGSGLQRFLPTTSALLIERQ